MNAGQPSPAEIMTDTSKIAVIATCGGNDIQDLLARSAETWRSAGGKIVGVLAERRDTEEEVCSACFLRDIASGRRFAIALEKPPTGTTCHLDAEGVGAAGTQLITQIPSGDVVILSKFGKLEGVQQGLWTAFSMAVTAGKPLLTTVSSRHVEAWTAFAPTATWLNADPASLAEWWQSMKACK